MADTKDRRYKNPHVKTSTSNILVYQETRHSYPHCVLPPNYFARMLAHGAGKPRNVVRVEPWPSMGSKTF